MSPLRHLLTGPLTPAAFEEVARLLGEAAQQKLVLAPAEKQEIGALLEGAGGWIDGWQEQLRLHTSEPTTYSA